MTEKTIHASVQRLYLAAKETGDDAPAKVARRLNVSPQTLNNWEARGISQSGSLLAQRVYGCDAVWVTTGDGSDEQLRAAPAPQSQPVRLDPAILAETAAALRLRFAKVGGFSIEENPEMFIAAYEMRQGMTKAHVSPEVFQLVIQHADLTPQGAGKDGRSDGAPTHGADGRKMGGRRAKS